eukprot:2388514-Rhodomonas_salina.4
MLTGTFRGRFWPGTVKSSTVACGLRMVPTVRCACGANPRYPPSPCTVLTERIGGTDGAYTVLRVVRYSRCVWCYALCSADVAYSGTYRPTPCPALGTGGERGLGQLRVGSPISYALARRIPVLAYAMPYYVHLVCYATSGTDVGCGTARWGGGTMLHFAFANCQVASYLSCYRPVLKRCCIPRLLLGCRLRTRHGVLLSYPLATAMLLLAY